MSVAPKKVRVRLDRIPRGPWIYARQVDREDPLPDDGDLVEVVDEQDRFIGHAHFNNGSDIRLRMLWRGKRSDLARPAEFLERRLAAADRLRRKVLDLPSHSDVYRIVHAEGDGLSGLIVDRLGDVLVCEHHALGWWRWRNEVATALRTLHPGVTIVHRMPERAARSEGLQSAPRSEVDGHLPDELVVHEHGVPFAVRPGEGHKTGFFCDQRDNRQLVRRLAADRSVADVCCNAGGFAINAALGGARGISAIDLDERILELAERSAELAGPKVRSAIEFRHADAFEWLRRANTGFGLVVLDPPKWAVGRKEVDSAQRRYLDLNALGIAAAARDGLVLTFSCSGALELPAFLGIVFAAARRSERRVQLLGTVGAGADHPQDPDFARSRYLKGALLRVE